jgi:hypothetical protein
MAANDNHDIANRRVLITPDRNFRPSVFAGHRNILTNLRSANVRCDLWIWLPLFPLHLQPRRIATSADESHQLNSAAPLATILNDVFTFSVGGAFLKLHCLFAYNAAQETYQRAFIVVQ